ncbi:MAG: NAD-dependent epimerase/dehydratase family protein [Rubrobacter sp.]|nr:NAD-dependent epimerase/dehydratase family protein [Rubrobacter sp.]
MSKIVVTGGLGFIGSHVADAHLAGGDQVTIIDSQVASVIDGTEHEAHPQCTVIRKSVEEFFEDGGSFEGVDRIVHAASHVGPASILQYAGNLGSDMVRCTEYVLEGCVEADAPLCVFSSAEVYGRSGHLGEKDDIRVPTRYNARIEYAIGKTLIEAMTINSARRGLKAFVIRPFNVAGSRQSQAGGFVMPTFVQQALSGHPITVFATGRQVRSFTSATDLSRFLTRYWDAALESGEPIFNIGNPGNSITIWRLAERIKDLLDSESEIVYTDAKQIHGPDYEEAESFEKVPALGAALDVGWKPQIGLDELILETADYYSRREDYRKQQEENQAAYASH